MLSWRAGEVARKERPEDVFEWTGGCWRYIGTMVSAEHARRACAVTRPNPYIPPVAYKNPPAPEPPVSP